MTSATKSTPRKTSILQRCVIAALLLHLMCVAGLQWIASKFATIFKDVLGEDVMLPTISRFFIASPNLILLVSSILLIICVLVFAFKYPSRRRSIILLVVLIPYTLLLVAFAFIALWLALVKITPGMGP